MGGVSTRNGKSAGARVSKIRSRDGSSCPNSRNGGWVLILSAWMGHHPGGRHPTNFLGLLNPGLRASFGRRRSWARSSRRLPGSDRSSVFSSWLDGGTRSIPRCHRAGLGPVHVVRRIFSSRPVINSNSGRTFEAGSDRSGHCRDEPLVHLHELGS